MANVIYPKPLEGATDDTLILDTKNMYKRQFPMKDDWTQIHVGFFYSWTTDLNSLTGNNIFSYNAGGNPSGYPIAESAQTTNETFNYIGISRYGAPDSFLPDRFNFTGYANPGFNPTNDPDKCFYGMNWDRSDRANLVGGIPYGQTLGQGQDNTFIGSVNEDYGTGKSTNPQVTNVINTSYFPTLSTTYAGYVGIDYEKTTDNKLLTYYNRNLYGNGYNAVGDTSIAALKVRMNNSITVNIDRASGYCLVSDYSGNSPDCFFFYNAFNNMRLRIHSMGVKKVK